VFGQLLVRNEELVEKRVDGYVSAKTVESAAKQQRDEFNLLNSLFVCLFGLTVVVDIVYRCISIQTTICS
jgi:hypothetical protein